MPTAKVNGVEIEFENGMTVLQVAELAGEEIHAASATMSGCRSPATAARVPWWR